MLNNTEQEKADLEAWLLALTDERVRLQKSPFDHPQLFIPNGHPGDATQKTTQAFGIATDQFLEIPAVGRDGGTPFTRFLGN